MVRNVDVKSKILEQYAGWKGVRYRLGGSSKRGIDCSAFVQTTFREQFGMDLPRSTSEQQEMGKTIQRTKLRPGDLVLSMASWIGMLNRVQRDPQIQQTAELVVSVVTITKAALTHSAPDLRRELLIELVSNEGIRIFSLQPTDTVEAPPPNTLMPEIAASIRAKLGPDTRISARCI